MGVLLFLTAMIALKASVWNRPRLWPQPLIMVK